MTRHPLRPFIATFLATALIALSPGWGAYQAFARTLGLSSANTGGAPTAAVGGMQIRNVSGPSVGVSRISPSLLAGSLPMLAPVTDLNVLQQTVSPEVSRVSWDGAAPGIVVNVQAAPSVLARTTLKSETRVRPTVAAAGSAQTRAPPADAKKQPLLARLSLALPNFSSMGRADAKAAALSDFSTRIGRTMVGGGAIAVNAADESRGKSHHSLSRSDNMPDQRENDEPGPDEVVDSPQRRSDGGPDDATDPDYGDRGGSWPQKSTIFVAAHAVFFSASLFYGGAFISEALASKLVFVPLYLGLMIPAFILHEMGHAWAAKKLGDPGPALQGRLSFKLKNLAKHIDPIWTLAVPIGLFLATGLLFGGARAIETNADRFARPDRDSAIVAFAGPAVNFALAALGGIAFALATALGAPALIGTLAASFVFFNVLLGVFNLIPVAPLDGHHISRWFLSDVLGRPDWGAKAAALPHIQYALLIGAFLGLNVLFPGAIIGVLQTVTSWFLGVPLMVVTALGLGGMVGMVRRSEKTTEPNSMEAGDPRAIDREESPAAKTFIVQFDGATQSIQTDAHLGAVDVNVQGGIGLFRQTASAMGAELMGMGLTPQSLGRFNATPIATYRRINAATLQVAENQSDEFKAAMEAQGYRVYENEERNIITPIEDDPSYTPVESDHDFFGETSIDQTKKLSTMDKVHEIARKKWGSPTLGGVRGGLLKAILAVFMVAIPQPLIGVVDTGIEPTHKSIAAGLKAAKDIRPGGDGVDINGHGTWTHGTVNLYAPWLKNSMTHYKAFSNQGATLDDVLKALTMSANDGNLVISNSWGSNSGDPESPDSQLVKKMAEEGHIMVFAAGNNGRSGRNTIGSPAITVHTAPNGAPRVISVAATDSGKRVTGFSSKGEGSRVTSRDEKWKDYPRRPDMAEQGNNTEGPWPSFKRPTRTDAKYGPVRVISGTSMSTPKVAGTIAMLAQLFGVTQVGEELDRIVWAVMDSLDSSTGQEDWAIGDGFSVAFDAYQKLSAAGMRAVRPNWIVRLSIWLLDKKPVSIGPPNPRPEAPPRP
ncbi:MAG: hypothetical protein COB53_04615 [Elusimicrobia bacterium]|nr:MAG: hypothetical protein COB53_04615 [Elusimicrobiota bacterium]